MTRALIGVLTVMSMLWLTGAQDATSQSITTCADFQYQDDAQKAWDRGDGRARDWYSGMDADNDGVACENLPAKPITKQSWFWPGAGGVVVLGITGVTIWWSRKTKLSNPSRNNSISPESLTNHELTSQDLKSLQWERDLEKAKAVKSEPNAPPQFEQRPPVVNVTIHNESSAKSDASAVALASTGLDCEWEPGGKIPTGRYYNGIDLDVERDPDTLKSLPYWVYLRTKYWQDTAKNARRRVHNTCEAPGCGNKRDLHVHHRTYDRGREKPEHLQVLCASCHRKVHNRL